MTVVVVVELFGARVVVFVPQHRLCGGHSRDGGVPSIQARCSVDDGPKGALVAEPAQPLREAQPQEARPRRLAPRSAAATATTTRAQPCWPHASLTAAQPNKNEDRHPATRGYHTQR